MQARDPLLFHYCPKQVVFSKDLKSVLLAKRAGEADYDGVFSFIGGKTETTDGGLLAGLKREKDEEIGAEAKLKICWSMSCYQTWFVKSNGKTMVLPHHVAIHTGGDIKINPDEYSECRWVPVADIDIFEPLIGTTPAAVHAALRLLPILTDDDFDEI
ncbi:MAG TPA: NUDIX domain-containing protein [Bacillota bacterium]|nr:NUDIX domain-containing protein [Bacillota bacterium]